VTGGTGEAAGTVNVANEEGGGLVLEGLMALQALVDAILAEKRNGREKRCEEQSAGHER
jgi:flavin-dependent dehydrogenase